MPDTGAAVMFSITGALGAALLGLLVKVFYEYFKPREVPKAGNGFMTLTALEAHCKDHQGTCTRLILARMEVWLTEIRVRLDRGEARFSRIERRLTLLQGAVDRIGNGAGREA